MEIINNSGEKRKICMYKGEDRVAAVPQKCFEMNFNEKVVWNREGDNRYFHVKVFRPALLDKYLYTRQLPSSTWVLLIGKGNTFGYSTNESNRSVTKYRLKICNHRFNQKIYFALGFETNKVFITDGWWSVTKGKCVEVAVSQRLYRPLACKAAHEKLVRFRRLDDPKTNQEYYYLTF